MSEAALRWEIDPRRSRVRFSVKHLMVATIRGEATRFEGTLEGDGSGLTRASGTVEVAGLRTGDPKRDEVLLGRDFFDAADHPRIRFASSRIEPAGAGRVRIAGELTIRGRTHEVGFEAEHGPLDGGSETVELRARGELSRERFGVTGGGVIEAAGAAVSDRVAVELELLAQRCPDPEPALGSQR